jgi:putative zinc finger/helix-turn-helix YgiT family protein
MKRCASCKSTDVRGGAQSIAFDMGPHTFEGQVAGHRCASCEETFYDGDDLGRFEQLVARWLADNGFTAPDEIKFLRKTAGLRARELAELLDVTPETVSHWENGKHPADPTTREVLAALVLDALDGRTTTRDRLVTMKRPPLAKGRVRIRRPVVAAELQPPSVRTPLARAPCVRTPSNDHGSGISSQKVPPQLLARPLLKGRSGTIRPSSGEHPDGARRGTAPAKLRPGPGTRSPADRTFLRSPVREVPAGTTDVQLAHPRPSGEDARPGPDGGARSPGGLSLAGGDAGRARGQARGLRRDGRDVRLGRGRAAQRSRRGGGRSVDARHGEAVDRSVRDDRVAHAQGRDPRRRRAVTRTGSPSHRGGVPSWCARSGHRSRATRSPPRA